MEVNKQQKIAMEHGRGTMMVLAGPGSGKTFTITRRIRYLIRELDIPPEEILVITFTKAAAREMEKRFFDLMENEVLPVTFGTFHAIYFHIIKSSYHYDYSNIITEKEKKNYIREAMEATCKEGLDGSYTELLLSEISRVKNEGTEPEKHKVAYLEQEVFSKVYKKYEEIKLWNKKIDFDDMVLMCRTLFLHDERALEFWRKRYRYILVDEFQDINSVQYDVLRMLAAPENNLFVVGDDDQSIYGFRGAKPGIMLNFKKDYPRAKMVTLPVNYRSTPEIVRASSYFVGHNKKRYKKKIKAMSNPGELLRCIAFSNKREEADFVAELLSESRKKMKWEDMAVLYRSNRGIEFIMKTLSEKGIPFVVKERISNPFTGDIYKDIAAYLSVIYGEGKRADFLRIMNKPVRYMKREYLREGIISPEKLLTDHSVPEYVKKHLKKLCRDLHFLKEQPPYGAINYIRKGMGYEEYLLVKTPKKNLEETISLLEFFSEISKNIPDFKEWKRVMEATEEEFLASMNTTQEKTGVNLSTMHASKGLEYRLVILPDVNEGNIPQPKAEGKDGIEEERRIFYVAMTRAKEQLYLLYLKNPKENRLQKSRFLSQIKYLKEEDYSSSSPSINSSNS